MNLNFKTYGVGKPLLILHGLFGMLDNWNTLGRKFGALYQVFLIDLRNHGKSPHHPEMNYLIMAEDVVHFIKDRQLDQVNIIGHSMGGKVAMQLAVLFPDLLNRLIVADIAPKSYIGSHQNIFNAIESLNLSRIMSRKQADELLTPLLPEFAVRQFILKNLTRGKDGAYFWRPAISYIKNNYTEILSAIEGSYAGNTLFIKGENSSYIQEVDKIKISKQFRNAQHLTVQKAGHWVHAEQPLAFFEAVKDFFME